MAHLFNTYTSSNGTSAETLAKYNSLSYVGDSNSIIFDTKRKSIWAKGLEYGLSSEDTVTYVNTSNTPTVEVATHNNTTGYSYISGIYVTKSGSNPMTYTISYKYGYFDIPDANIITNAANVIEKPNEIVSYETDTSINIQRSSGFGGRGERVITGLNISSNGNAITLSYAYTNIYANQSHHFLSDEYIVDNGSMTSGNVITGIYVNADGLIGYSYSSISADAKKIQYINRVSGGNTTITLNNSSSYMYQVTEPLSSGDTLYIDCHYKNDISYESDIRFSTGETIPHLTLYEEDGVNISWEGNTTPSLQPNAEYKINISYEYSSGKFIAVFGEFGVSSEQGGITTLEDLSDVDLGTLTDGDALIYDSTLGKWTNGEVAKPGRRVYFAYTSSTDTTTPKLLYCPDFSSPEEDDILFYSSRYHNTVSNVQFNINNTGSINAYTYNGTTRFGGTVYAYNIWFIYKNNSWVQLPSTDSLFDGGGTNTNGDIYTFSNSYSTGVPFASISYTGGSYILKTGPNLVTLSSNISLQTLEWNTHYEFDNSLSNSNSITFTLPSAPVDGRSTIEIDISVSTSSIPTISFTTPGTGTIKWGNNLNINNYFIQSGVYEISISYDTASNVYTIVWEEFGVNSVSSITTENDNIILSLQNNGTTKVTSGTSYAYVAGVNLEYDGTTNTYTISYSLGEFRAPDTNTWRDINVNGSTFKGTGTSTGLVNFVAGSNVTLSTSGNNITIAASGTDGTGSGSTVSFTRSLSSGTKIGAITIDGTSTDIYAPTDTNTNTWRDINVNGSTFKGTGTSTGLVNFVAGSNVTLSTSGNNITIAASGTDGTGSGSTVSFTRSLSSGTKIGAITIDGTSTDIYAPTDTNTNTWRPVRIQGSAWLSDSSSSLNIQNGTGISVSGSNSTLTITNSGSSSGSSAANGTNIITNIKESNGSISYTYTPISNLVSATSVSITNGTATTNQYISGLSVNSSNAISVTKSTLPTYTFTLNGSRSAGVTTLTLTGGGSASGSSSYTAPFVTHSTSSSQSQIYNIEVVSNSPGTDANTLYIVV